MSQKYRAWRLGSVGLLTMGMLAPLVTTSTSTATATTPFKVCMGTGGTPGTPWQTGKAPFCRTSPTKRVGRPWCSATQHSPFDFAQQRRGLHPRQVQRGDRGPTARVHGPGDCGQAGRGQDPDHYL